MRTWRRLATAACFLALTPVPVAAQEVAVDVELVLAVDVSASIDGGEVNLQRAGYLAALTDPRVVTAMLGGMLGRVAIAYVEWSDGQRLTVDWTVIDSANDARLFAATIASHPIPQGSQTNMVGAIDFSASLFEGNGIEGTRRVIDLSADGRDSIGIERLVSNARDRALARGIVINGLVINPQLEMNEIEGVKYDLEGYFRALVIGGPGAFVTVTRAPDDFRKAVANKLVLEIADRSRRRARYRELDVAFPG